jgi:hypothetical protein
LALIVGGYKEVTRMFKKAAQRGRSKRGSEAYSVRYVEPQSDASTKLEAFFNILSWLSTDAS